MAARIAIVGAGAIGARHLQGLARLDRPLEVDIVDPSEVVRTRALDLLAKAGGLKAGNVRCHARVATLPSPDVAVVATNARERSGVIAELLEIGTRRFVLEKVLFTRLSDYDWVERLLIESRAIAYVNCPRRAYPGAKLLMQMINGRPFSYHVEGQGWGLACNVIHHLDELAMLSGSADIQLAGDALLPGTVPAKREGYIEFVGTLTGSIGEQCTLSATCKMGAPTDRIVTIACDGVELCISQLEQTLSISDGVSRQREPYPIPLQSELTALHVEAILDGREPTLPDYATAARLHRSMLRTFLDHLRRTSGDASINECPIT
jgi:predicted dehydrogenase